MRIFLSRIPLLLLPVLLFLALFHPATLDIGNAGWLIRGSDNGENALGIHAWLHDPAPGFLATHLLNAPEGVGLLFTDSNPLLGAVVRPLAPILPADAQFVGPWILLCLILQVFFAWLLLRRFAPGPIALWCGVALMAALPTLANRYIHANLMSHWLILWALWRFCEPGRAGSNRGWAVLIAIAAFVHNYLVLMVLAIWASAMIERFVADDRRGRFVLVGGSIAILAMVGTIAWLMGAGEPRALAGNYGAFAMPIDAVFNSGNPAFSSILPSIPQRIGRGFEGFQYLGAGLILLLPVSVVLARRRPPGPDESELLHRLLWLAPALVVLTLLAISNYPDIAGHALPRFPLPAVLAPLLDMVRASGRLFWPVAYVIVLVMLLVACRLPRSQAGLLLAAILAVQSVDLSGMFATIRGESAEAGKHRLYVRTINPRWDTLIARADSVAFVPADATRDLALFQEVAWRATSRGIPVRIVYAARDSRTTLARLKQEDADVAEGRLQPNRLYILTAGAKVGLLIEPHRLTYVDGVAVIAPLGALGQ